MKTHNLNVSKKFYACNFVIYSRENERNDKKEKNYRFFILCVPIIIMVVMVAVIVYMRWSKISEGAIKWLN